MTKSELKLLIREVVESIHQEAWKKATLPSNYSDAGLAWRVFGSKLSQGNKELESCFHAAVTNAEKEESTGSHETKNFRVEVDYHRLLYKIWKIL